MMKKILFLHGFYASGQCVPAVALHEAFDGRVVVLTPDLPMNPYEAVVFIRALCDKEKPDLLVGNSCGSFYAQMIAPVIGIPALLGNPHFQMTEFLRPRVGAHQYKSPRKNGKQDFIIDEQLISAFAEMEEHQFDNTRSMVGNMFGDSLESRTRWHISSRYSSNTTTIRSTSLAVIHPLPMRSKHGTCH